MRNKTLCLGVLLILASLAYQKPYTYRFKFPSRVKKGQMFTISVEIHNLGEKNLTVMICDNITLSCKLVKVPPGEIRIEEYNEAK